jgi:hypothetical protein
MIVAWKKLQHRFPEMYHIINAGIVKLEEYQDKTDLTPAYVLAMSLLPISSFYIYLSLTSNYVLVLDPKTRLTWFEKHAPEKIESAKELFLDAVSFVFISMECIITISCS